MGLREPSVSTCFIAPTSAALGMRTFLQLSNLLLNVSHTL